MIFLCTAGTTDAWDTIGAAEGWGSRLPASQENAIAYTVLYEQFLLGEQERVASTRSADTLVLHDRLQVCQSQQEVKKDYSVR